MKTKINNKFVNILLNIYKSLPQGLLEAALPFIDFVRKLKNKPPVPKRQKLAQIDYPVFIDEQGNSQKVIMLHGVSVGEVISLENLIKKIKEDFSDYKLILTTSTVTGYEIANKKYSNLADFICYFPLDIYRAVETFLNKINPCVILIAETELWPNFARCANEKNIPLFIINGRISDNSFKSYLRFKGFLEPVLNYYCGIFAQSEVDKDRFIALGASKDKVEVMKNLKFEIEKKECDIDLCSGSNKVLIAGSTHFGEDEIVLNVFKKLRECGVLDLKLILAPRHLTRMEEINNLLGRFEFNAKVKWGYRSKNDTFLDNDIIILDTLGELSKIYKTVDVAFIGGSFNKTGGHNPLEAIIYSKPVISGPSIKNFRDIYSILTRDKAAFVIKNQDEFFEIAKRLLFDNDFYIQTSKNCLNCFEGQQGALDFVIKKLNDILRA